MEEDKKKDFLLRVYDSYWKNINRAEESAWKIFAGYTALFAGLSLAHPVIGNIGFLFLFLVFSYVSIWLALRSNLWYVRNLGLTSNMEQEFLRKEEDYGKIVPCHFLRKPSFFNKELWWIHIITYVAICATISFLINPQIQPIIHQMIVIFTLCSGMILSFIFGVIWYREYETFLAQAKGKYGKTPNAHRQMEK